MFAAAVIDSLVHTKPVNYSTHLLQQHFTCDTPHNKQTHCHVRLLTHACNADCVCVCFNLDIFQPFNNTYTLEIYVFSPKGIFLLFNLYLVDFSLFIFNYYYYSRFIFSLLTKLNMYVFCCIC